MFNKMTFTASVGALLGSAGAAFAQLTPIDVSGAVTSIEGATAPVIAIGTAVVSVAVVMMVFKMIRGML